MIDWLFINFWVLIIGLSCGIILGYILGWIVCKIKSEGKTKGENMGEERCCDKGNQYISYCSNCFSKAITQAEQKAKQGLFKLFRENPKEFHKRFVEWDKRNYTEEELKKIEKIKDRLKTKERREVEDLLNKAFEIVDCEEWHTEEIEVKDKESIIGLITILQMNYGIGIKWKDEREDELIYSLNEEIPEDVEELDNE